MRHAWKYGAAFGFITAALSVACTVTTDDDVGTGGTGGTSVSGGTGGTSTTGGTGGTSVSGGTGGTSTTGGTGGSTGGTGGSTGGTGGSTGGSGGTGDTATCDPTDGSTAGTPYPNCDPQDTDDACEACIQANCCEESKNCYATDPLNVCGWGGPPSSDPSVGAAGEISCYRDCLTAYVNENGVCDSDGIDMCASMCVTPMCGGDFLGSATSDLAACMQTNCSEKCFGAAACDAG